MLAQKPELRKKPFRAGGAPQEGKGGRPPPQLEHWGGIAPPTLGYNTKGCLKVHYIVSIL